MSSPSMSSSSMSSPAIWLSGWSAFAPRLPSTSQFATWLSGNQPNNHISNQKYGDLPAVKPPGASIPPMLRRRCSPVTKMALDSFFEVIDKTNVNPSAVSTVFASRHGELSVLVNLFESMFNGDSLSPIAFSNSVHHTTTGFLSIISKNKGISRTISAGAQTFNCALLETFGLLQTERLQAKQNNNVAIIAADECVPLSLGKPDLFPQFPFAVSLMFTNKKPTNPIATLTINNVKQMFKQSNTQHDDMLFTFLKGIIQ